jgi:hypothetical protein
MDIWPQMYFPNQTYLRIFCNSVIKIILLIHVIWMKVDADSRKDLERFKYVFISFTLIKKRLEV